MFRAGTGHGLLFAEFRNISRDGFPTLFFLLHFEGEDLPKACAGWWKTLWHMAGRS
jgi:hypothetical protein